MSQQYSVPDRPAKSRKPRHRQTRRDDSFRRPDAKNRPDAGSNRPGSNDSRPGKDRRTDSSRPAAERRTDSSRPAAERRTDVVRPVRDRRVGSDHDRRTGFDPAAAPVAEGNGFAALGLPEQLVSRLARDGITTPFPIQAAAIPDALAGVDVLGRGRTGSGKTLGFGLPMVSRLTGRRTRSRRPRGLVMVPTRELAMQVKDVLAPLARAMDLSVALIAGGLPYPKQIQALERGVDILIATPGRLIDLCEQGACDLSDIEITVLDEADHMCDLGFRPAITQLMDMTPVDGQRLLFSATLDGDVGTIVRAYLDDPVTHSTDEARAAVTTMAHHLLMIEPAHKQSLTAELASRDGRTIVFVRTKRGADRVAGQLRDLGVMAAALHGGLAQGARNRTLDQFKDGSVPVLVATDVAARGIHVDDVGLVVQADPPGEHKDYLHRAGRTARAGGSGAVVTLVLPHQRREVIRLAESAGVAARPVRARPGDRLVTSLSGGATPSGTPVRLPVKPAPERRRSGGYRGAPAKSKRYGSRPPRDRRR